MIYHKLLFYLNNTLCYINYNELSLLHYIYQHKANKLFAKHFIYEYIKDYIQLFIDFSGYEMDYDYSVIKIIGSFEQVECTDKIYYNVIIDEEYKILKLESSNFNYKEVYGKIIIEYSLWNGTLYNKNDINNAINNNNKITFIKFIINLQTHWKDIDNKFNINEIYKLILYTLYYKSYFIKNSNKHIIKHHFIIKSLYKNKDNNEYEIELEDNEHKNNKITYIYYEKNNLLGQKHNIPDMYLTFKPELDKFIIHLISNYF